MYFREFGIIADEAPELSCVKEVDDYLARLSWNAGAVKNIVPWKVARAIGAPTVEVIQVLLAARNEGLLQLFWRLECPIDGGPISLDEYPEEVFELDDLPDDIKCDVCATELHPQEECLVLRFLLIRNPTSRPNQTSSTKIPVKGNSGQQQLDSLTDIQKTAPELAQALTQNYNIIVQNGGHLHMPTNQEQNHQQANNIANVGTSQNGNFQFGAHSQAVNQTGENNQITIQANEGINWKDLQVLLVEFQQLLGPMVSEKELIAELDKAIEETKQPSPEKHTIIKSLENVFTKFKFLGSTISNYSTLVLTAQKIGTLAGIASSYLP
jgi:hypothetical protein